MDFVNPDNHLFFGGPYYNREAREPHNREYSSVLLFRIDEIRRSNLVSIKEREKRHLDDREGYKKVFRNNFVTAATVCIFKPVGTSTRLRAWPLRARVEDASLLARGM